MEMKEATFTFTFFLSTLLIISLIFPEVYGGGKRSRIIEELEVEGSNYNYKKLMVFGDSYADTGNWEPGTSPSWKQPYGITFPGKPSGRYTDGRTLTDYIASYIGISSPLAYRLWESGVELHQYGINFAYRGAGVFDTIFSGAPNMTTQIDYLRRLLENNVFTKHDIISYVAFVTVSGNDYTTSLADVDDLQVTAEYYLNLGKFSNEIGLYEI